MADIMANIITGTIIHFYGYCYIVVFLAS